MRKHCVNTGHDRILDQVFTTGSTLQNRQVLQNDDAFLSDETLELLGKSAFGISMMEEDAIWA